MTRFLFDLDGTITKQETLPLIAEHFHVKEEIGRLTQETIAGNVPFEESFVRRVRLLGDLPVDEVSRILETVELHPQIVEFIQRHRTACHIVTGNLSCWICRLVRRFGCKCHASEAIVKNNRIERLSTILRKEHVVKRLQEAGHSVVFIGDGNNDVEAMRQADISIASALTHAPTKGVLSVADYLASDALVLSRYLDRFR